MAKIGDRFGHPSDNGMVRVMAVAAGWCMCRRPRCAPFVMSEKDVDLLVARWRDAYHQPQPSDLSEGQHDD